jgi:hypothetical protein
MKERGRVRRQALGGICPVSHCVLTLVEYIECWRVLSVSFNDVDQLVDVAVRTERHIGVRTEDNTGEKTTTTEVRQ